MEAVVFMVLLAVVGAPVGAAVLVSVASRREDRRWSLGGTAPGRLEAVARWIVDFHSEAPRLPRPKNWPEMGAQGLAPRRAAESAPVRGNAPAREKSPARMVASTSSMPDAR